MSERLPVSKRIGLVLGPLLFFVVLGLPAIPPFDANAQKVLATAALMVIWWVTEAIPLSATALVPMVVFPLLDVLPITEAFAPYSSPSIYLFMGGFVIALAMEKWNLHPIHLIANFVGYQLNIA